MNKKLIPELRFPEFVNEGEWEERFVEEFFSVASSKRVLQEDWKNQGVPFYRTRELVSLSKNEPFGNEIFISEDLFLELSVKYGVPSKGDFLVSGVGTLGICYQVKANDRFYFKDGNVLWFKLERGINSTYFKFCFQSDYIQNQILKQASISTVGTYTIQNAKKTTLWYPPSLKEQQKIASCLSSLDEVITAHSQKLELLKEHKKGLMQNLFPQEGKKVPKYRFKEFVNDGEWKEKTIGQIFNSFSGGTPNTSESKYYNGNIPFIRSAEINKEKTELFLTEEGLKNSSAKLVNKGDLLVALYGANSGDSAISKIKGAINQAILCLQSEYSNAYTYHFLTLKKNWIVSRFIQGGQGNLSGDIVKSIPITLPLPKEQKKIASSLSALDNLITAQTEKIEQLKQHKKGLMQGLFPKMND